MKRNSSQLKEIKPLPTLETPKKQPDLKERRKTSVDPKRESFKFRKSFHLAHNWEKENSETPYSLDSMAEHSKASQSPKPNKDKDKGKKDSRVLSIGKLYDKSRRPSRQRSAEPQKISLVPHDKLCSSSESLQFSSFGDRNLFQSTTLKDSMKSNQSGNITNLTRSKNKKSQKKQKDIYVKELYNHIQKDAKRLRDSIAIENCIILPDDPWKIRWDYFMIILLLYMATIVPYRIAFYDTDSLTWIIIDSFADLFFGLDIILNFYYAYFNFDEELIIDKRKIAKRYLTTWFFIDVVAIMPFNLIFQTQRDYSSMARLARLPRLYRLVKMLKLVRMMRIVRERNMFLRHLNDVMKISASLERLIAFVFIFVIMCHINACLWYLVAKIDGIYPDTWVVRYGYQDSSNYDLYVAGFYWTITTVTTVGFGDISPGTNLEKWFAMLVMVVGVITYSFSVGSLSSILSSLDSRQATLNEKLEILNSIKNDFNVPMDMYMRLRKALKYDHSKNKIDRFQFLKELPNSLQLQLSYLMHHDIIRHFPFFRNKSKQLVAKIGPLLRPQRAFKDEIIYREGDSIHNIYFLIRGSVEMVLPEYDDAPFLHIKKDYHFGELEFIKSCVDQTVPKRLFTLKAKEDCEMLCLSEKNLLVVLADHEHEMGELFELGEQRYKRTLIERDKVMAQLEEDQNKIINPRVSIATFGLLKKSNPKSKIQRPMRSIIELEENSPNDDKNSFDSSFHSSSNGRAGSASASEGEGREKGKREKYTTCENQEESENIAQVTETALVKPDCKLVRIKSSQSTELAEVQQKISSIRNSTKDINTEEAASTSARKINWKRRLTQNFGSSFDIMASSYSTPKIPTFSEEGNEDETANGKLLNQLPNLVNSLQRSIMAVETLKDQLINKNSSIRAQFQSLTEHNLNREDREAANQRGKDQQWIQAILQRQPIIQEGRQRKIK